MLLILAAYGRQSSIRADGVVTNCTEAALAAALTNGGHVLLSCDSAINLTQTIVVAKDTILDGTGHSPSLTGSQSTNLGRLLLVQPGIHLTLRRLTLAGGRLAWTNLSGHTDGQPALGAAIYNDGGVVSIDGCTISDHQVTGGGAATGSPEGGHGGTGGSGLGAAIYNSGGQLSVTNTVFSDNSASGGPGGAGGAGYSGGNGRQGGRGGHGGPAAGGAIFNTANGLVTLTDSLFSSNRVTGASGGAGGLGSGTLGFPGDPGDAGPAAGAAVYNESGTIIVVNCTFVANAGTGAAGAAGFSGSSLFQVENGTTGGTARGGGIANQDVLRATNCTFVTNVVSGGTGGAGGVGSPAGFGGDGGRGGAGGAALGGGIHTGAAGRSWLVNCTFSDNAVLGGAGGAGGSGSGLGKPGKTGSTGEGLGAALFSAAEVRLRNSILANSGASGNASGSLLDEGFNLSSDNTPTLNAEGSRNGIAPLLGALTVAGGHVPLLTLASNSPAINAIVAAGGNGCPSFDGRNAQRTEPCDIGAYESDGVFLTPTLTAQVGTNQVILSWPMSTGFVLQRTTALADTNVWTLVTDPARATNGLNTLNVDRTGPAAFFRLGRQ